MTWTFSSLLDPTELSFVTICIRLVLSFIFSGILGLERTRKRRPAGLRTYILVGMSATIIMMTQEFMTLNFPHNSDVGRLPAQVVTGIGFLGAGTIMITRYYRVRGLTTAAGLWGVACIGLAIGIGFYVGAFIGMLALLFILLFAAKFEYSYTKNIRRVSVYLLFASIVELKAFLKDMRAKGYHITDLEVQSGVGGGNNVSIFCLLHFHKDETHEGVIEMLRERDDVMLAEELES